MVCDPADLPVILLYNLDRSWPESDLQEVFQLVDLLVGELASVGHPARVACLENQDLAGAMAGLDPERHIVFNWCEEVPGIPRSSSLVARGLEELGFTFTGTDSQALLFSQDKPAVKQRLSFTGVPIPAWQLCEPGALNGWDRFPAIVKPAYEHCSFGITSEAVVWDRGELEERVRETARAFQGPVMVEDFIAGREFHVSIVGNGRLRVLPIAEMDFSAIPEMDGRLCTYDSKFQPGSSDYQRIQLRLPAPLSPQEKNLLEKTAIAAYQATGCRDYARLDIRERDGIFHVLDVNPNSDLSPDTSLALAAEQAGMSYGGFSSYLIQLAAKRHPVLGKKKSLPLPREEPAFCA